MSPSPAEFTSLLIRAKEGDQVALGQLLERYGPALRRAAHKLIGKPLRSFLDAEDLVQAVQITLLKGIQSGQFAFAGPVQFCSLAKTLMRRKLSHYWRKVKPRGGAGTVDGPLVKGLGQTLPDQPLITTDRTKAVESRETVDRVLGQLETVDRRLLELRMEGYSTADAARLLHLDAGFLRMRLVRLRQRLHGLLPEAGKIKPAIERHV